MTKKSLKDSILNQIEKDNIKPRSKWYFFGKNLAFWGFFVTAIIFGSISFAVILFALQTTDFDILDYLHDSEGLSQLLVLMPFVWVLIIGMAIGMGIWGLKHTKKGYRIALVTLVGTNILGSIFFGSLVYGAGGGEVIEEVLEEKFSFYEGTRKKHQRFWGRPEDTGRLAGMITEIDEENKHLTLTDPHGKSWEIPYENLPHQPRVGTPIKMRGEINEDGEFIPKKMKKAERQERIHRKIEDHFRRHPELRQKIEDRISPETKQEIESYREQKKPLPPELRGKIFQEVQQNTPEEEKQEIREAMKEGLQERPPRHPRPPFQRRLENQETQLRTSEQPPEEE